MLIERKDCPMRHENGNCTVAGGFCMAVNDPICEALHNAYDCGRRSIDPESLRPKWISVEDRLPDSMDDVLVWYEYRAYDGSGGLSKRKVKEYGIGCYIPQMGVWSKDPGIGTEARVIAWMPLPKPPGADMRGEKNA